MNGREWTTEEDEYLIKNYSSETNKVISKELKRSVNSIVHRARKLGVTKSNEAYQKSRRETYKQKGIEINKMSKDDVPLKDAYMNKEWLIYNYYEKQYSSIDLAEMTGVEETAILRWMDLYGLERRTISEITERTREKISKIASEKREEKVSRWNGGKTTDANGYKLVLVRDHPHSNRYGYVREHRLVMEFMLARLLTSEEVVHHRDGNRSNNVTGNLFLFPNDSVHAKFHAYKNFVNRNITEEEYMDTIYITTT